MDFQKLTIKAQEAFASAQGDAIARGNPELTPEHLLAALVDQEGGVAPRILEKAGESPAPLGGPRDERVARPPPGGGAGGGCRGSRGWRARTPSPRPAARCGPRWRRRSPRPKP